MKNDLEVIREKLQKQEQEYPHQGNPEEKQSADRALEESYKAFVLAGGTIMLRR